MFRRRTMYCAVVLGVEIVNNQRFRLLLLVDR